MGEGKLPEKHKKKTNNKKTNNSKYANKKNTTRNTANNNSNQAKKNVSKATNKNDANKSNRPTKNNELYKEIYGLLLITLGILGVLSMYIDNVVGLFGKVVCTVVFGMFGLAGIIIPAIVIICGIFLMFTKNIERIKKKISSAFILIILISAIIQVGYNNPENYVNLNFFKYIQRFFSDGTNRLGGGVIGGLLSTPFIMIFQKLGALIVFFVLSIIVCMVITDISLVELIRNVRARTIERKNRRLNAVSEDNIEIDSFLDEKYSVCNSINDKDYFKKNTRETEFRTFEFDNVIEDKKSSQIKAKADNNINELYYKEEEIKNIDNQTQNNKVEIPIDNNIIVNTPRKNSKEKVETLDIRVTNTVTKKEYKFPPFNLLNEGNEDNQNYKQMKISALENAKKLEYTLRSFGINAKVINVTVGPAITRYELQPDVGVKVSRIVSLTDDIALNLAASGIRIEAPIPGKAAIGIEVPNEKVAPIVLREVIETSDFVKFNSRLAFALGKDVSGNNIIVNIAEMPHLLIAGATGSGKSVCINTLIISLLYKATPDEVKILMIDPKVVELQAYNGIPHLLIPVVTDPKKAAGALNWAVQEMIKRYKDFADRGVRDIGGYNRLLREKGEEGILPQIVIIIDELADLMMAAPNDVEDSICRLAQMARAAGMHLVIATQRPSVNVITGVIKANIPSRIAFSVSSQVDSRTIIDMAGAEKLLGKGDMLYCPYDLQKPMRAKGAFVNDKEVLRVVEYVKAQSSVEYDDYIIDEITNGDNSSKDTEAPQDLDELLTEAIDLVVDMGQASVSFIQRKFKVGYARAGRIIDQMAERGIISGYEGSKPRRVLISKQQWEEIKMGSNDN